VAQGHSVDEYLETIYFLAFPIGEYHPATKGAPTLAVRVADMLGVSRASAGEMLKRLEADGLVERGEVSGAELHRAYLDAIAERDPELHAYLCTVDEPDGEGVPIALKDVIGTKGVETTAGSKILERYRPPYSATAVERLTGAGATFPYPIYSKWFADYAAQTSVRINYQAIGSGGGIRQLSDGTVDFGASDSPMTDGELQKAKGEALGHRPSISEKGARSLSCSCR